MRKFLNKIICGDCIEVLGEVTEPFADLVFADPPFNIGYKYDKYYDKVKNKNYIAWTRAWMEACNNVLKPDGSFYIAIGDDYAANVKTIADELGNLTQNLYTIAAYYLIEELSHNGILCINTTIAREIDSFFNQF